MKELKLFVQHIHTEKNEKRTGKEIGCDLFAQYHRRKDDSGYRVEIHPVGTSHSSKTRHAQTPCQITQHGCHTTKKQEIYKHCWTQEDFHVGHFRHHQIIWQYGQNAIEEHLACDKHCRIAVHHRFHQQRVESPTEACPESKSVAKRREMEHEMSVEHNYRHAHTRQQRPCNLQWTETLGLVEQTYYQGCEQGAGADDERHVCCRGKPQRLVLA